MGTIYYYVLVIKTIFYTIVIPFLQLNNGYNILLSTCHQNNILYHNYTIFAVKQWVQYILLCTCHQNLVLLRNHFVFPQFR